MIESLNELKAIRDGAPLGATYVDNLEDYVKVLNGSFYGWSDQLNEWGKFDYLSAVTMRSLSDINRIIELEEYAMSLEKRLGVE